MNRQRRVTELDLTQQQLLQETLQRRAVPLQPRERVAEAVAGSAFMAAAGALWLCFDVSGYWNPLAALGCFVALVFAMRIRFDAAGIYTMPGQLVFIPLLFTLPPQAVPPVVVLALMASRLPDVLRGDTPPSRLVLSVANAWFSIGPAAVLLAADSPGAMPDSPLLIVALFAAQVVGDFAASAVREALVRGASLREQIADATWVYGVDAALTPVALFGAASIGEDPWKSLALLPLLLLLAFFARERAERLESVLALTRAYRGMALVLGDVVEADDQYTGEHCKDVVTLATTVGERMDLGAERRRNLEFGALLHDVGKIAVPKSIINKPGKLTDEEFEIIKRHPVEGQRMLERVGGFMRDAGVIVRHHHERWNGGGYPDGLAGEAIPLEARIVGCCDTLNAMTTNRPYRKAMPMSVAADELRRCAGTQFDPAVVAAVVEIIEQPGFVATLSSQGEQQAKPTTIAVAG